MNGRTRTWADVADYLGMTQREAWDLLKDDPAEVADSVFLATVHARAQRRSETLAHEVKRLDDGPSHGFALQ
jgi:hypothetical protein